MSYYDDNELIAFPLTGNDDLGIPSDVIVDVLIHAPAALGTNLAIRSISVTGLLVSIIFTIDGTDVAVLTALQPEPQTMLEVTPLLPGVEGFVVLGFGVTRRRLRVDGSYPLMPEALLSYQSSGSTTLSANGHTMTGLVKLTVGAGLSIAARTLTMQTESGVVTALAAVVSITDESLLVDPVPPCLRSPDGTPKIQPLVGINDVVPDCSGDIGLVIVNVREIPTDAGIVMATKPQGITLSDEGTPCG